MLEFSTDNSCIVVEDWLATPIKNMLPLRVRRKPRKGSGKYITEAETSISIFSTAETAGDFQKDGKTDTKNWRVPPNILVLRRRKASYDFGLSSNDLTWDAK